MIGSAPKVYTKLQLGSITIPPTSDFNISEDISLISAAKDIRRTVNGEAVNVSRGVFKKHAINISSSDLRAPGIHEVSIGSYCEVVPSEPWSISSLTGAVSVSIPRACIDVVGVDIDGNKYQPVAQPASLLPLQLSRSSSRIAALRTPVTVNFGSAPVVLIRYRPILACLIVDWSTSSDECAATAGWSISFEEI